MPAQTLREAIAEAIHAIGLPVVTSREVHHWIERNYPRHWIDISTAMRDLALPRLPSSNYSEADCFLERVGYRLRAN